MGSNLCKNICIQHSCESSLYDSDGLNNLCLAIRAVTTHNGVVLRRLTTGIVRLMGSNTLKSV